MGKIEATCQRKAKAELGLRVKIFTRELDSLIEASCVREKFFKRHAMNYSFENVGMKLSTITFFSCLSMSQTVVQEQVCARANLRKDLLTIEAVLFEWSPPQTGSLTLWRNAAFILQG